MIPLIASSMKGSYITCSHHDQAFYLRRRRSLHSICHIESSPSSSSVCDFSEIASYHYALSYLLFVAQYDSVALLLGYPWGFGEPQLDAHSSVRVGNHSQGEHILKIRKKVSLQWKLFRIPRQNLLKLKEPSTALTSLGNFQATTLLQNPHSHPQSSRCGDPSPNTHPYAPAHTLLFYIPSPKGIHPAANVESLGVFQLSMKEKAYLNDAE